jgi:hypothetical protein
MREEPDKVDLFLGFQMALVVGFVGLMVFGLGDWIGIW